MIGRTLGHYEILEKLGEGGMGEVYRANDLILKRSVALKVLPTGFAKNSKRLDRFQREAEALASLDHPNIVTIHSVEGVAGVHFLTMQLLEGECLSRLIPRNGVSLKRFFAIAAPLTDALTAAHEKGVIHRDLKPSNVMVTAEGRVKVLDFGLAKLRSRSSRPESSEASTEALTEEGAAPGTVPYMSPEQVQALPADERSDIFSLGVVLYEMVTGKRPFAGKSSGEVTASILRDEPVPVSELRGDLPHHISRILRRCLQKDPDARYQVARDLYNDLQDLSGEVRQGSSSGSKAFSKSAPDRSRSPASVFARWLLPALVVIGLVVVALAWWTRTSEPTLTPPLSGTVRLAVLPSESSVDEAEIADWSGLVQVLLSTDLTGSEEVGVLDPQAVRAITGGSGERADSIDRRSVYEGLIRAQVDFVVESTVHPGENGFQLLSSLVDPATQEIFFSATADVASRSDLPARVRELADSLLSYIQVEVFHLAKDENLRPWVSIYEHDIEAIKAFLQATEYIYRYEPGGSRYLLRALEVDPDFVVARLWLIAGLVGIGEMGEAQQHLEYLQGLAGQASPVEQSMIDLAGSIVSGDIQDQANQLEFLLQYSPGNHILLENLGEVQAEMGDCRAAVGTIMPVVEARWSYPPLWVLLGECLIELGDFEAARSHLEEGLSIGPMMSAVYAMLEPLHLIAGNHERAGDYHSKWIERAHALPDDPATEVSYYFRRIAEACLDQQQSDCAVELMQKAISYAATQPENHDLLGRALLARGEPEDARAASAAALALDPSWATSHLNLARIAEAEGEDEQAIEHYRSYLSTAPPGADTQDVEDKLSLLIDRIENRGQT